jgi:hypothetical protein
VTTFIRFGSFVLLACIAAFFVFSAMTHNATAAAQAFALAGPGGLTLTAPRRRGLTPQHHPRVAHFMPYLRGDSLAAIWLAIKLGFKYIDQNGQCDADGTVWITHWGRFRKQYMWMWTGQYKGRGKLRREVRVKVTFKGQKIEQLHTHEVDKLRSARFGGQRPRTARRHMEVCAAANITLCFEAKDSVGFLTPAVWARLRQDAIATGAVVIVMTLTSLYRPGHPEDPYTRAALAVTTGGFPAAMLPRTHRPADLQRLHNLGIEVWGRWV